MDWLRATRGLILDMGDISNTTAGWDAPMERTDGVAGYII